MKAIRTKYIPASNTKPSRISAATGERGQRVIASYRGDWTSEKAHACVARQLCDKMGWRGEMIGGGFPDGSMVWVFADSSARA